MTDPEATAGRIMLDLVRQHPGRYSRKDLLSMFKESERANAAKSLGRLIGKGSGKLSERNARLYPAESEPDQAPPTNPVSSLAQPLPQFAMPFAGEEPIEIPEYMQSRRFDVTFIVRFNEPDVRRIGLSNTMSVSDITWLPPGGRVLTAAVGDFEVMPEMELNTRKYLCLVVKVSGRFYLRYYQAPAGESFVLSWDS